MTKPRILVADDEESIRVVMRNSLRQKGYEVDCAENGKQAAKMIDQTGYDVILADIRMPEMDGFEATRCIRAAERGERHVPIIGLTAHASAEAREACLKAGMDDFISKPYTLDELGAALARWSGQPVHH